MWIWQLAVFVSVLVYLVSGVWVGCVELLLIWLFGVWFLV